MASYSKTIICLANSRKLSGRCVAGKELLKDKIGPWIRPISGKPTGELSWMDRRFRDGGEPELLDVIEVPMVKAEPHGFQTENHLIDADSYWRFRRKATWDEAIACLDKGQSPLWDDASSSGNGIRDRVTEARATEIGNSLKLIEVQDLQVRVAVEGAAFGNERRTVRGHFSLGKTPYLLSITDPPFTLRYRPRKEGSYDVGHALLCVSLGEPFEDHNAYKLIAGVLIRP